MKKRRIFKFLPLLLLVAGTMMSCSSGTDDSSSASHFQVRNFANTGCKTVTGSRGETQTLDAVQEYIEYKGMTGGFLSLNHVNVRFNCEPGELKMTAVISGDEIRILETEENPGANCICPYDLYCEVGALKEGDYTVVICQDSYESERARFNISYTNDLSGKFVVRRNSDDDNSQSNNDMSGAGTIDYYGTAVPYTPVAEQDFPEWLRELRAEKSMLTIYRICVGTLNNKTVYHLNLATDSSIIGRFYDENGSPISFSGVFDEFVAQIRNVRCVYYHSFSNDDSQSNNDTSGTETIDYYGTAVPYTPVAEQDFPEWLRELRAEKSMLTIYRICVGTLNNKTVYHLNVATDSSIIGRFYDENGSPITFSGVFDEFIAQIRNVRCIYLRSFE